MLCKILIFLQILISFTLILIIILDLPFLIFFTTLISMLLTKLIYDIYINIKYNKNLSRLKKIIYLRCIYFDLSLILHNIGAIFNFFFEINIIYFSFYFLVDSIIITFLIVIHFKSYDNIKFDINLFNFIIHYLIWIQIINNCLKFNNWVYSNWVITFWVIYLILFIMSICGFWFFLIFIYMLYYYILGNETDYNFWSSLYGGFLLIINNIIYFFLIFKIGNYLDCKNNIQCELSIKNSSLIITIIYFSSSVLFFIFAFVLKKHLVKSIIENFINPNLKSKRRFIINDLISKKIFPKNLVF